MTTTTSAISLNSSLMKRTDANAVIEGYVRSHLSPKEPERGLISKCYNDLSAILQGENFQSGSYARFTSTTPVNDLDVIWVIPQMVIKKRAVDPTQLDPTDILEDLAKRLRTEYGNKGIDVRIKAQTHSVGIYFGATDEDFSIDVVPAMDTGNTNEFGQSMYLVPEIARLSKQQRLAKYASGEHISWIPSDPRGYIESARILNEENEAFRKAVKFAKAWRAACKRHDENFPLKSFHLEQLLTRLFMANKSWGCLDAIEAFFIVLPTKLDRPEYPDRADPKRFIDEYITSMTDADRYKIAMLCELAYQILLKTKSADNQNTVSGIIEEVLAVEHYADKTTGESFLPRFGIRTSIDPAIKLNIIGSVQPKQGFREYELHNNRNRVGQNRKIKFREKCSLPTGTYITKWKVKNRGQDAKDRGCLRGEITDHRTRNDPEDTAYIGHHYVECYAIVSGVCVAKARQEVIIE